MKDAAYCKRPMLCGGCQFYQHSCDGRVEANPTGGKMDKKEKNILMQSYIGDTLKAHMEGDENKLTGICPWCEQYHGPGACPTPTSPCPACAERERELKSSNSIREAEKRILIEEISKNAELRQELKQIHEIIMCIAECPPISESDTITVRAVKDMAHRLSAARKERC